MQPEPLYFVWDYNDVDRDFWARHLEDWVPRRVVDAHTHVNREEFCIAPVSEERRESFWVSEVSRPMDAETAARCDRITFPGRQVTRVAMGSPSLHYDLDRMNAYVAAECAKRNWHALAVTPPATPPDTVAEWLAEPGVIGVKPYYNLIGFDPDTRDKYIEASIFDYLPHGILEVLDERRAWVTLHVSRAERLPHPGNVSEIKEIRRRYPNVVLVVAHFGRCYAAPYAEESLPQFADDPGLYFDNSAVLNPAVHRLAIKHIGPERILYGTDNPVFYMRGRRQWKGRAYINRTNRDFKFNKEREAPEIEANYTLYMYEAMKALKDVCEEMGITREQVEAMFCGNAERLIGEVLEAKRLRGEE